MSSTIREGKMGFGLEFARVPGELVFRPSATTSLRGEPLMCDTINTSYDLDSDEGGAFGNGITPVSDGTILSSLTLSPIGVCQDSGVATGSKVRVIFQGITKCRVTAAAPIATRYPIQAATASRHFTGLVSAASAAGRWCGFAGEVHGGTGVESITCLFFGIGNQR